MILWLFFSVSSFAQSNCDTYEMFLKRVHEDYSELSSRTFPNYIKYTISAKDSLKILLYNVEGELVCGESFGLLDIGTYIVKFYNPKQPGVYFVSSEIGKQGRYKKSILITSEEPPSDKREINPDTSTTIINGKWKRSYSEKFIPALQPEAEFQKVEYHFKYNLLLVFSKGDYKIVTEITRDDNINDTKSSAGKFIIAGDSLKLYENSKLQKVFQYKIENDTLSLSYFESQDKKTGALVVPMNLNIYGPSIKLTGKYHK